MSAKFLFWLRIQFDVRVSQGGQAFLAAQRKSWRRGVHLLHLGDALAIYREITSRGIAAKRPFVGNAMWVTSVADPDGYRLDFESPTDAPEESEYTPENP